MNDINPKLLGGSDAAAIVEGDGLFALALRILHDVSDAGDDPFSLTGKALEPVILQDFADHHGLTVTKPESLEHPKGRDWQRVSLDGEIAEWPDALVDAKWRFSRNGFGEPGTDEVQDRIIWQMQAYLEATDREVAHVAVYFGGPPLTTYAVRRNAELGGLIVESCERFWRDYIVPRKLPPFQASDVATRWMDRRFTEKELGPKEMKILVPATPRAEECARLLREFETAIDKGSSMAESLKLEIQELIGENHGLEGQFGKFTWTRPKPKVRTDWAAVAEGMVRLGGQTLTERRENLALLTSKHTKTTNTKRTFRTSWKEQL